MRPKKTPLKPIFLRLPEVQAVLGIGRTSVYRLLQEDSAFPGPSGSAKEPSRGAVGRSRNGPRAGPVSTRGSRVICELGEKRAAGGRDAPLGGESGESWPVPNPT